jgi:putative nucleotidyltransferase with HDIG domain
MRRAPIGGTMPDVVTPEPRSSYSAVPLVGLVGPGAVPFALYLRTADDVWVLYHSAAAPLDDSHVGRLVAEGRSELFIHENDRTAYFARVEHALDEILRDRQAPIERRADVLHGVALRVAEQLLAAPLDRVGVLRAQRVMMATSGLLLRETQGLAAIRRVMAASDTLASHSLTVGFLSMALARVVLGADASTMLHAGLAGLLHDVGRAGHEGLEHDPEHAERGASLLHALALPTAVVEAARSHHERHDGSGYPAALRGEQIPTLARVVGIVDTFDKIYSGQQPRVGVFDALRILAQAYRGCFEERLALDLVKLFRN